MTNKTAIAVSHWQYETPYSIYSFKTNPETICEFLNGDYYAATDVHESIMGYFCFGKSAQIPTTAYRIYTNESLDVGLGMNPDLCGNGLGHDFLKAGLDFAHEHFHATKFRLTVAVFNQRAIRVYEKCGFHRVGTIKHAISHNNFFIMKREIPQS